MKLLSKLIKKGISNIIGRIIKIMELVNKYFIFFCFLFIMIPIILINMEKNSITLSLSNITLTSLK